MEIGDDDNDAVSYPPDYKSPYETNFISKVFFMYMGTAMSMANERAKKGESLKGMEASIKILRK